MSEQFSHYFKDCPYDRIDVYRVLQLFNVTDPALQHAIKKLLVAGGRGHKDAAKDIDEAIVALQRWQAMRQEEAPPELTLNAERFLYGDVEASVRYLERSDIPNAAELAGKLRLAAAGQASMTIPPMQQQPEQQRAQFIDEGTREVGREGTIRPGSWRD